MKKTNQDQQQQRRTFLVTESAKKLDSPRTRELWYEAIRRFLSGLPCCQKPRTDGGFTVVPDAAAAKLLRDLTETLYKASDAGDIAVQRYSEFYDEAVATFKVKPRRTLARLEKIKQNIYVSL